jgi:hypothetical protein
LESLEQELRKKEIGAVLNMLEKGILFSFTTDTYLLAEEKKEMEEHDVTQYDEVCVEIPDIFTEFYEKVCLVQLREVCLGLHLCCVSHQVCMADVRDLRRNFKSDFDICLRVGLEPTIDAMWKMARLCGCSIIEYITAIHEVSSKRCEQCMVVN